MMQRGKELDRAVERLGRIPIMICERYVIPKEVRVLLFWYGFYVFIRGGFENSAESSFPIKSFRLL
jgi:hypothetical protein